MGISDFLHHSQVSVEIFNFERHSNLVLVGQNFSHCLALLTLAIGVLQHLSLVLVEIYFESWLNCLCSLLAKLSFQRS